MRHWKNVVITDGEYLLAIAVAVVFRLLYTPWMDRWCDWWTTHLTWKALDD